MLKDLFKVFAPSMVLGINFLVYTIGKDFIPYEQVSGYIYGYMLGSLPLTLLVMTWVFYNVTLKPKTN